MTPGVRRPRSGPSSSLSAKDLPADLPVHLDELGVDRSRGPRLGGSDPRLDVLEELLVAAQRLTRLGGRMCGEVGHPLPERNEVDGGPNRRAAIRRRIVGEPDICPCGPVVAEPDQALGLPAAASANTHTVRRCARQSEIASGAMRASRSSAPIAIAV